MSGDCSNKGNTLDKAKDLNVPILDSGTKINALLHRLCRIYEQLNYAAQATARVRRDRTPPWGLTTARSMASRQFPPHRIHPQRWDVTAPTMAAYSTSGRAVRWQRGQASAPGRLMGTKPQQPSFVALWPEQQKGDNERSVRSSAPIGFGSREVNGN